MLVISALYFLITKCKYEQSHIHIYTNWQLAFLYKNVTFQIYLNSNGHDFAPLSSSLYISFTEIWFYYQFWLNTGHQKLARQLVVIKNCLEPTVRALNIMHHDNNHISPHYITANQFWIRSDWTAFFSSPHKHSMNWWQNPLGPNKRRNGIYVFHFIAIIDWKTTYSVITSTKWYRTQPLWHVFPLSAGLRWLCMTKMRR